MKKLTFLLLLVLLFPPICFSQDRLFGIDKYIHAVTCSAGTGVLTNVYSFTFPKMKDPALWAAGSMFVVGVGKEVYDIHRTGFSLGDIGANFVGCSLTYATYKIPGLIKKWKHKRQIRNSINP